MPCPKGSAIVASYSNQSRGKTYFVLGDPNRTSNKPQAFGNLTLYANTPELKQVPVSQVQIQYH